MYKYKISTFLPFEDKELCTFHTYTILRGATIIVIHLHICINFFLVAYPTNFKVLYFICIFTIYINQCYLMVALWQYIL